MSAEVILQLLLAYRDVQVGQSALVVSSHVLSGLLRAHPRTLHHH
jgi:hypothetical protein